VEAVAQSPFSAWESFYVIVGSSAAALTGLQFVVIALGAEARTLRGPEVGAFGTPTIVHFCEVLLVAAILSAPWQTVASAALVLCLCGAAGIAYTVIVVWRAARQTGYAPVLEDWTWHAAFPLIAYMTLMIAAYLLESDPHTWLFVIAATALFLLFIGIHNAWDAVTYVAVLQSQGSKDRPDRS
jgi:hypothetical protein